MNDGKRRKLNELYARFRNNKSKEKSEKLIELTKIA